MNEIEFTDLTLEDLLPHRGKMLLINKVLGVKENHAVTRSLPNEIWPMAGEKGVSPLILVELAAQTAGVYNGWDRIQTLGIDSEKTGWLVGIKKATFLINNLTFGIPIITRAENTHNFSNLKEVSSVQRINDKIIGEITLQLYQA